MFPDWLMVYALPALAIGGAFVWYITNVRKRHYEEFVKRKSKDKLPIQKESVSRYRSMRDRRPYTTLSRNHQLALMKKVADMCLANRWDDIVSEALKEVNPLCRVDDETNEVGIHYASDAHKVFLKINRIFGEGLVEQK